MVRATRLPLGRPYKIWITTGEIDGNGYVATAGDRGWYYGYWKGLHALYGHEGYVAAGEKHHIRPSYEQPLVLGMTWLREHRAVIQEAPKFPLDICDTGPPGKEREEMADVYDVAAVGGDFIGGVVAAKKAME